MIRFFQELSRSPDGEGGGGAASPAPAAAAGAVTQPAAGGGVPPAAAVPPVPPAGLPPVPPAQAAQAYAPAYWPEGLDASLQGTDDKSTLDNLAKSLNGYRARDTARDVPATAADYYNFDKLAGDFKIDPKNQPYFDNLKTDPAFKAMSEAMLKNGIGRTAGLEVYQAGLTAMAEAGMLEPMIDAKAERAALVPDAAKALPQAAQDQAVEKRMTDNLGFLDLMVANKGLPKDARDYAEMMLGDSAKGHQFIEFVKGLVQGSEAQPGNVGVPSGGMTRESLRAEMASLDKNAPDYAAKSAALDEKYKKLFAG